MFRLSYSLSILLWPTAELNTQMNLTFISWEKQAFASKIFDTIIMNDCIYSMICVMNSPSQHDKYSL